MKTEIRKTDLLQAIKSACLIARKIEPVINQIRLSTVNSQLQISVTDYDQIYNELIDSDTTIEGSFCVPAHKLLAILKNSKAGIVEIEQENEGYLTFKLGRLKIKLPCFEGMTFPACEIKLTKPLFFIQPKQLKDLFDKTFSFISDNEGRRNLMGLNIKNEGSYIRFMGADAFRIADYKIWDNDKFENDFNIIFPKPFFKNAVKIFDDINILFQADRISLQVTDTNRQYQCKLIEAEYPVLDKLLQHKSKHAVVESDSLIESAEMMQVLTDKIDNAVMKCTFNGSLELESQKMELLEGSISIDCEYNNNPVSIGLNVKFFTEISKVFKKENNVKLSFEDCNSPFLMSSDTVDNYKAALMPVRLQW